MDYDEFEVEEDQLEEVEILENEGDQPDPDMDEDDNEGDGVDADDAEMDVGDTEEDPLIEVSQDMSIFTFTKHTDFVYCAAMHPTKPGLVATGETNLSSSVALVII